MENTVLVLGAGFSMPYGYPSGERLLANITYDRTTNEAFSKSLIDYDGYSIDKFLNEVQNFQTEGLQLIAKHILEAENTSHNPNKDEDVIRYLLNEISEDNYKNIRILSFNYDRLFEWKFLTRLKAKYKNKDAACDIFADLKIHHIHGRMPKLRDLEKIDPHELHCKYALQNASPEHKQFVYDELTRIAPEELKTIYTNSKDPDSLTIDWLKWADRIAFLGFAFDDLNMSKLGFNTHDIKYYLDHKTIVGTRLGLPPTKVKSIEKKYPFLKGNLWNLNCKALFEQEFSLNESEDEPKYSNRIAEYGCCFKYVYQERPKFPSIGIASAVDTKCPSCNKPLIIRYTFSNPEWQATIDDCRNYLSL